MSNTLYNIINQGSEGQLESLLAQAGLSGQDTAEITSALKEIDFVQGKETYVGSNGADKVFTLASDGTAIVHTKAGDDVAVSLASNATVDLNLGAGKDFSVSYASDGRIIQEAGLGNDTNISVVEQGQVVTHMGPGKDTDLSLNSGGYTGTDLGAGKDTHVGYTTDGGGSLVEGQHGADTMVHYADNSANAELRGGSGPDAIIAAGNVTGHGNQGRDTMIAFAGGEVSGDQGKNLYVAASGYREDGTPTTVNMGPDAEKLIIADLGGETVVNNFNAKEDIAYVIGTPEGRSAVQMLKDNGVTFTGVDPDALSASATVVEGVAITEIKGVNEGHTPGG